LVERSAWRLSWFSPTMCLSRGKPVGDPDVESLIRAAIVPPACNF
jgi:hypothetical protein